LLEQEFEEINNAVKSISEMACTKIVFLSVNKNLKTKYLIKKGNNQYDRPAPGTVVDSEIIKSNLYDFYLVST
jgi:hypothetical protein